MSTHSSFYSYELCLLTVNTLANATDLLHQQQYYLIVLKQAGAPARGKLQWLINTSLAKLGDIAVVLSYRNTITASCNSSTNELLS